MITTLATRIHTHLSEAGYSAAQINEGIDYANTKGYSSDDDALSLVLTRILYSQASREDGERFAIEPCSWPVANA